MLARGIELCLHVLNSATEAVALECNRDTLTVSNVGHCGAEVVSEVAHVALIVEQNSNSFRGDLELHAVPRRECNLANREVCAGGGGDNLGHCVPPVGTLVAWGLSLAV